MSFPRVLFFLISFFFIKSSFSQDTLRLKNIDAILYKGSGNNQPLIVGLGGSEGGNAWASRYWKSTRDQFLERGYAFLAIGYFNTPNSPKQLDKIALEDVYGAIRESQRFSNINMQRIAIIGGSRGADLALLLASYYPAINCVVGLSASHVVFPGNTTHFSSSSWTYNQKELPFVPVNKEAYPFIFKRDLRNAFTAMLTDAVAEQKSAIQVEKINGPVLLLSGKQDEICPSTEMCNKIITRLKQHGFTHFAEHISFEGGHAEPLKHFDIVFKFLENHFRGTARDKSAR